MFEYLLALLFVVFVALKIMFRIPKKPFRLTQLPHIAFKNIINIMDINGVINLAKSSRSVRCKLKQANRKIFKIIIECHEDVFTHEDSGILIRRIIVLESEESIRFVYYFMMKDAREKNVGWFLSYDVNFLINCFCTFFKRKN